MSADDPWDFSRPARPSGHPAHPGAPGTPPRSPFDLPGADGGGPSPFGDLPGTPDPGAGGYASASRSVGPPMGWLAGAVLAAVAGLVVAALSLSGGVVYLAGWFVAGPVAIGLLAGFARGDAVRQTALLYSFPTWKPAAYRGALLLSLLAVIALALRIASWAGHL